MYPLIRGYLPECCRWRFEVAHVWRGYERVAEIRKRVETRRETCLVRHSLWILFRGLRCGCTTQWMNEPYSCAPERLGVSVEKTRLLEMQYKRRYLFPVAYVPLLDSCQYRTGKGHSWRHGYHLCCPQCASLGRRVVVIAVVTPQFIYWV